MNCKCDYNNITTIMLDWTLLCVISCKNEEGIYDDTMCPEGQFCNKNWGPCGGKCSVPYKRKNWLHYLSESFKA